MKLQSEFVRLVQLYYGERGASWLLKLPELIHYSEQKWDMKIHEPYTLSVNYVAPALLQDGGEVVVKICLPGDEFLNELEALQQLGGCIVKIIDYDLDNGIFLLHKVSPGTTLAEVKDDEEACRIAANVLKELTIEAPVTSRFPSVHAKRDSLRTLVLTNDHGVGPISKEMLEKALRICTYLLQTPKQQFLLHGDFHHYNVLSSRGNHWTAIDPKGLIGELEFDIIQFLLNKLPRHNVYELTEKRINIFTQELHLDKERLLLWGYCHSVLATSWTIEGNNCDQDFFQMIDIFEELYHAHFNNRMKTLTRD
ncbi:aminoglycoside phosphotransferase family protein [Guptibacillus hwajinpoensis]|uniref:Streptomycin 6-kinase n=1 Tax=Guptibacillus hwajinpoensis TaxID=208199 RepID=A0ABU0K1V5_9BACL|nr:aminoglycoside phosphotransferase family protein [Alkalihalobacillus hemicentroti]MDQ0483333.1 streptomycin 6-kinase [Alkalihalobacillus hemicentroti]